MSKTPTTLQIMSTVFVFICALLLILEVGSPTLLIPLNIFAVATVFMTLCYGAVSRQNNAQAKRLLTIGISLAVLALLVFVFGQIL